LLEFLKSRIKRIVSTFNEIKKHITYNNIFIALTLITIFINLFFLHRQIGIMDEQASLMVEQASLMKKQTSILEINYQPLFNFDKVYRQDNNSSKVVGVIVSNEEYKRIRNCNVRSFNLVKIEPKDKINTDTKGKTFLAPVFYEKDDLSFFQNESDRMYKDNKDNNNYKNYQISSSKDMKSSSPVNFKDLKDNNINGLDDIAKKIGFDIKNYHRTKEFKYNDKTFIMTYIQYIVITYTDAINEDHTQVYKINYNGDWERNDKDINSDILDRFMNNNYEELNKIIDYIKKY